MGHCIIKPAGPVAPRIDGRIEAGGAIGTGAGLARRLCQETGMTGINLIQPRCRGITGYETA